MSSSMRCDEVVPFGRELLVHLQDMTYLHQNCGLLAISCPLMPICSYLYITLSGFALSYNPANF
ncbi:hypothetical protein M405DRAFT_542310 [Rhizopogon salebrosus TDB-379]|nr:hypothetical protein M405DRAFT_542310 [Rhizopogon salebrosus TDB-379]